MVVTTSKLLTTGANTKCVKLIVLDSNIRSMTEFKQIIGRGTRLRPDAGKTFFTILDFRRACDLFHDPDFDGPADNSTNWSGEGDPPVKPRPARVEGDDAGGIVSPAPPGGEDIPLDGEEPRRILVVEGEEVTIIGKAVRHLDENGKLVVEKFEDYTRRNILSCFPTEETFR